jgi:hypothetical protein
MREPTKKKKKKCDGVLLRALKMKERALENKERALKMKERALENKERVAACLIVGSSERRIIYSSLYVTYII